MSSNGLFPNKHGCSCFMHTVLILSHFLFMFFTLPCLGTLCSYCKKVSPNRDQALLLPLSVYMDALWLKLPGYNVLTHNDMLFLWVCWFTVEWFSSSISAGLEKHGSLLWRLNTGLLLRLNLFICHPTIHWETGDRRGRWCCFRGTTAGVLQPNGHVFTFGCFLISHCNENSTLKN